MLSLGWHLYIEAGFFALAAGMVYGIFGGGSGLFLMPSFYFLLRHFPETGFSMQIAIATTAALSAVLGYLPTKMQHKKGHLNFDLVKKVFPGLFVGMLCAVIALNFIPSAFLKKLFGVMVILVAAWFWFYNQEKDKKVWKLHSGGNACATFCIGLLWYLLGIAVFTVPYLHKCGVSMRKAVGAGTFLSSVLSASAAVFFIATGMVRFGVSHTQIGFVSIPLFFIALLPSVLGGYLGARLSLYLPQAKLKKIYSVLILVIGIIMLS